MFKINKLLISIFLAVFLLMPNLVSGMVVVDADSLGLECNAYNPILGHYDSDGIHLMEYNKIREICDVKDSRYGLYQRMNKKLAESSDLVGNTIYIGGLEDNCTDYGEWIGSTCVLNQDLNENIEINANNINLDCNGHSITGPSTYGSIGISMFNKNNIIIKNCVVKRFQYGFRVKTSHNINLTNNTAIDNTVGMSGWGFYLDAVYDSTLLNNKVDLHIAGNPNSYALYGWGYPEDSYNNKFLNNEARYNTACSFYLYNTHDNIISNNTLEYSKYSFYSYISSYNTFSDNEVLTDQQERVFYIASRFVTANYNIITRNIIRHPPTRYGIIIDNSSENLIYDNYFIGGNGFSAVANTNNYWNITKTLETNIIGGPYIGGNYWDDYTGEDLDGDSIGDTEIPYNSSDNIIGGDYLPLVPDIVPPIILILSPENTIYSTNSVDLTFTIDEEPFWIGYSLDGTQNITIEGNTTLIDLSEGTQNILVYANDTSGNMGSSDTIFFTIDTPPQYIIWDLDKTLIHRGESLKAYAKWNENIENAYVETDINSGSLLNETIPVASYWTNATLTHNIYESLGDKQVRIYAQDLVGNWNKTTIKNFDVYGWSKSKIYVSDPFKEKGKYRRNISCLVKDADISLPLSDYYIEIYADDSLLTSGYTDNDGWFNFTCLDQYATYKCAIYDDYEKFYHASFNGTFPPPDITILSPQNKTYSTSSIPLTFTINEPLSWIGYSLDNQPNVTIEENTTLYCLANTAHSIILYANDTSGNTGYSDRVYFTINVFPGDVIGDCVVDILDLAQLGKAYGSTPSSTNWDPYADLTCNGIVDIFDLFLVGRNYGKKSDVCVTEEPASVTTVYVEPERILNSDLTPNTTFDVNISVEQVNNLYAFEFKLKYNPNILNAVKAVDTFLNKPVYTGKKVIDNNKGEIWFSITSWTGAEPKTGKGALATITFQVKDIGRSSLELYDTKLADFDIKLIGHNTTDGYFSNTIPATIDINPDALNLKDKGKWIIAYIELPGYDVNETDISTVRLNDTISAEREVEIGDYDKDRILDLRVTFNIKEVIKMIEDLNLKFPIYVELTVTGALNDGTPFEGEDTIKVVR